MLPYWLLFCLWMIGALQAERAANRSPKLILFTLAAVATTLMIGLRVQVGGDWVAYERIYNSIFFLTLRDALPMTDAGYAAVNWASAQVDGGIYVVNLFCAALFVGGVGRLCYRQPNPALAMLVAVPYLVIVVAMGYTRQAAAIGVICLAIADGSERHLVRLVILIGIAALMHKTAVLMLPIALYPIFRRNLVLGGLGLVLFAGLSFVLLRGSADTMIANYVQSDYDSQGAIIRASMNVLAGLLFLWARKRIILPDFQKTFWTVCSVLSVVSMAALFSGSATAGIDRLSLYIIPLQVVVYSQLPYILGNRRGASLPSAIIGIIAYSFAVQYVWLNHADNAGYWVPYRNIVTTET